MAVQTKPYITPEEYLERERAAEFKSEYYNGEIFPLGEPREEGAVDMAGAKRNHVLLVSHIVTALNNALHKRPCLVFPNDMRVYIAPFGLYTYPDVAVVCGKDEYLDDTQDTLPTLLIEVLSPSTESYDRGQKFAFYRSLASLQEYVLVAQDRKSIEAFRKNDEGRWVLYEADPEQGTIELTSVDCLLTLETIYSNVPIDTASPASS